MSVSATGVLTLYRSSIGKKVIMAITGIIWVGFVVFHMYGNLKVFSGPEYFNAYAEGLRTLGEPLFGHKHLLTLARLGMVGAIVLHIWCAYTLSMQARKARPSKYVVQKPVQANYASLTMRWGGVAILIFLIYHLMHFTWGTPGIHNSFDPHNPYHNLVSGFQSIPNVILYLVAVTALGFHLYHGTWSMFQTLGLNNKNYTEMIRLLALALAIIVPIGFAIVPLSVMFNIVQ